MAEVEETKTQRAARLRREKRAAKIAATGNARLDKITGISGRSMSFREDSPSARNTPSPPRYASPPAQSPPRQQPPLGTSPGLGMPPNTGDSSPQSIKEQEEYIRALLRSQQPPPSAGDNADPTTKLLSNLLGMPPPGAGMTTPGGTPSFQPTTGDAPELSPNDIASALGISPSMANIFLQAKAGPASPSAQRNNSIWKAAHIVFATATSLYFLMLLQSTINLYGGGDRLPPPATVQNPFLILVMGELLLIGTREIFMNNDGNGAGSGVIGVLKTGRRVLSDLLRDGKIMIFILGIGSLWMNNWGKVKTE
ncbi:TPA_exp: Uncharacterized protein A8136_3785 [Trichophyton benhamiae CBS 112371]|uniref:GET complex, subunit GET2 n=1 Tax=Arthroderma benhamiae (strain ATCC MYA-4681 / CBS 112371) TaxID=663331 RepID=D4B1G4_ARTBC|nr:uncharacterized protein ARB_02293 [Trichophyton benhamiae CBS 112371]EFE30803.1 conserved hypothetical protein [Trichophyton benhamiae CBS 112371]DAA74003.1 TPA_exp: Uncharacterized protein A8136_3785 [Trichophyton benhamiae CBS 112371]